MVLEPLREEVLTDADAQRRDKPLSSYDESETNTDVQSEATDPVPPTACGTTYWCCVMLGESAEESVQIVVDGLRTRQIYLSTEEATPCAVRTVVAAVCFGQLVATRGMPRSVTRHMMS